MRDAFSMKFSNQNKEYATVLFRSAFLSHKSGLLKKGIGVRNVKLKTGYDLDDFVMDCFTTCVYMDVVKLPRIVAASRLRTFQ